MEKNVFEKLYRKYAPMLRLQLLEYLNNKKEDAEDLCQEAWLKSWQNYENLRDKEKFYPYLKKIALRLVINHVQRQKKWMSLEKCHEYLETSNYCVEELAEEMQFALKQLKNEQRIVLQLKYYRNHNIKEIAFQLLKSEQTVRAQLKQGQKNLHKILQ